MPPIPSARRILTDLVLQLKASGESRPANTTTTTTTTTTLDPLKACPGAREIVVALEYLVPGGVTAALDVLDKGLVTRYCLKGTEEVEGEGEGEVDVDVGVDVEREIPGTPNGSDSEISDVGGEQGEPVPSGEKPKTPKPKTPKRGQQYSYHVRSDQPPPLLPPPPASSSSTSTSSSSSKWSRKPVRRCPPRTYSVRPTAWFCSCDAFVFAAFAVPPKPVVVVVATSHPHPHRHRHRHRRATSRWEADEFGRVWDMMEACGWVWGGRMLGVQAPPVCKHLLACVLVENCGDLFVPFVKRVELDLEEMVGMSVGVGRA